MGSIVTFGDEQLNALERSLHTTEQQRVSLHAHSAGAPLQESFTLYRKNCYVRPRKNEDSDVSWFVLRGQCDVVLFDHQGNVSCVEHLGTVDSGMQYYFRIPRETLHTIVARTEWAAIVTARVVRGGTDRMSFPDWAPPESDSAGADCYAKELRTRMLSSSDAGRRRPTWLREPSSQIMVPSESHVTFSQADNDLLKAQRQHDRLDRLRICAHETAEAPFHEMLMNFSGDIYIRPAFHGDKDESLLILEGLAHCVFFDEGGNITSKIPLGQPGSGRARYCRVPRKVLHSLVVESESTLIKETTTGPFRPADTHFPSWAPEASDSHGVAAYLDSLRSSIRRSQ